MYEMFSCNSEGWKQPVCSTTGIDRMARCEVIKKNVADLDAVSTMGSSPRSIIKGKCIRGKSMSVKQYPYIPVLIKIANV